MYDFGVPEKQGSNEEWTNFSLLFRLRASLGHLWGTPGSQNGPKTSPKSLRDPSGRQFYTIVVLFLLLLPIVFVVLWVWFRQDIHTKKQSMQEAHSGKQHYIFATVLRCEP